jgi:chemotaxis protein CheD
MSMRERRAVGVVEAQQDETLNILAGELYFGARAAQVRTLLGSCVAIALWHPIRRLGAMCHYLLPQRTHSQAVVLDGRFGNEALDLLVERLRAAGTAPREYRAGLYGGASILPPSACGQFDVGPRNIAMGWRLIEQHGFVLQQVDVGDHVPRSITLDLRSGEVLLHRWQPVVDAAPLLPVPTARQRA